jgi:hypothetical protein
MIRRMGRTLAVTATCLVAGVCGVALAWTVQGNASNPGPGVSRDPVVVQTTTTVVETVASPVVASPSVSAPVATVDAPAISPAPPSEAPPVTTSKPAQQAPAAQPAPDPTSSELIRLGPGVVGDDGVTRAPEGPPVTITANDAPYAKP